MVQKTYDIKYVLLR